MRSECQKVDNCIFTVARSGGAKYNQSEKGACYQPSSTEDAYAQRTKITPHNMSFCLEIF